MDIFQFDSMQDVIPKMTNLKMENGDEKIVKIQLSPIIDDQEIVRRIMFIIEDITEEEKLKEAVRVSQEKAEYRIQVLQEIVSNTKSEFRVFIKEVFETLEEWGDEEGVKRSLHTIKGSSRFFNLESLSNKVHGFETDYEKNGIERTKEMLTELLTFYKESAQEVFGEEFLSSESDGSEEFIEVPKNKFEVDLKNAEVITTLRGFSRSKDGKIHTDSQSKILTVLLYLNKNWDNKIGNLRLLKENNNLDNFIQEISSEYGNLVAFKVTDNCWHGFMPFEGKRLSIQLNYIYPESLNTHRIRHKLSSLFKKFIAGSSN